MDLDETRNMLTKPWGVTTHANTCDTANTGGKGKHVTYHLQNIKDCILLKLLHRLQPNFT